MGLRIRNSCVGIVKESTGGTFVAPDSAPASDTAIIPVMNLKVGDPSGFEAEKESRFAMMGQGTVYRSKAVREISFDLFLKGSGTAGTVPDWDKYMLASGFFKTVTAATSVVYKWATTMDGSSSGTPAVTYPLIGGYSIAAYEDGVRYAIAGAMGDWSFKGTAGEFGVMSFKYQGIAQTDADIALPTLSTPDATSPVAFGATGFTTNFGGAYTAADFSELTIEEGAVLAQHTNANAASGLKGIYIMDRKPKGKINPDAVLVATQAFYAHWAAGTVGTLTTGTIGSVAGNKAVIAVGRAVIDAPTHEERDTWRVHGIPFRICTLTGATQGDEFSITLT